MNSSTQIVIIGAGPYGLSLAAHLHERRVPFRIFGRAMETWATQMPQGMKLKSDGFASNLYAGTATSYTLQDFCRETGRLYHPTQHPVPLEDFIAYGQEFARRFVPNLEMRDVTHVEPINDTSSQADSRRFLVRVEGGETLLASEVVLAVGLTHFPFLPEILRDLPSSMVSHTADHRTLTEFCSRDVTVLGRGASALNAAAILNECGARTTLVSRQRKLHIHRAATRRGRSFLQRLRHPASPLGYSLRSWLATRLPMLIHLLPGALRRGFFYKHLGPAGGSALRGRIHGRLPMLLGWSIADVELLSAVDPNERRIKLTLVSDEEQVREHVTSHLIAGTGFRVDVTRLRFLAPALIAALRLEPSGAPALDRHFGSSVPGLYFIGPAASSSFGPLLRFAAGAGFAAKRVSKHLARAFARGGRRAAVRSFEQAPARERHAA